ncbi:unnamed protein product [Camellia sinensis]
MSRTPTSYDAQHCEKIGKRMASCLERNVQLLQEQESWLELGDLVLKSWKEMVTAMHEGFLKDDLDQEHFCDNGGGI